MGLHPQAAAALALWSQGPSVSDPGFGPEDIAEQRKLALEAAAAEPREDVAHVEDVDADGVRCRLYQPLVEPVETTGSRQAPQARRSRQARPPAATGCIVYLHGGGFVFGDVDTHDAQARRVANRTGMAVLAVDYRRPPEHRFPAAPDDVDTALAWLLVRAPGLGLDLGRIVALGDSAGGNLALVAALRNPNVFAATVLVYPFVDPRGRHHAPDRDHTGLSAGECGWFWQQYAAAPADLDDPDLGPIDSTALGTLPPTLVVAADQDILIDEDVALARRIGEQGGTVTLSTYTGMIHGFWRHPALFDAAEQSLAEIAAFLAV